METKKSGFRSATLLQKFSHKINQDGPKTVVSTALFTVVKQGETPEQTAEQNVQAWNGWLSGVDPAKDLIHKPLEDLRREVVKEWKDIATLDLPGVSMMKDIDGIPSMADLLRAADVASVSWKELHSGKFHQLKKRFCEFASTMQKYSSLFEIVPSGDKYVCLITGVISSVIKISASYDKAAEAFGSGLESVKEELQYTFARLKFVKTTSMENHVAGLYMHVFEFLKTALKWVRILKSAVSDYSKEIEGLVANIKDEVRKVARYAQLDVDAKIYETHEEVRMFGQRLTNMEGILQVLLQRPEIPPELNAVLDLWYAIGRSMEKTLGASEQQAKYDQARTLARLPNLTYPGQTQQLQQLIEYTETQNMPGRLTTSTTYHRSDVEVLARRLQPLAEDDRGVLLGEMRGSVVTSLPHEVLISMSSWMKATETQLIWIEDDFTYEASSISIATLQLCNVALATGLPCISFFSQPKDKNPAVARGLTLEQAGLIALLYAIVLQLIQILPVSFKSSADLTASRFDQLDGSLSSAKSALKLIDELLEQIHETLHWILDGLNLLEGKDTSSHLLSLIQILRKHGKRSVSKVCFTNNGNSLVLSESVKVFERMDGTDGPSLGDINASDLPEYI